MTQSTFTKCDNVTLVVPAGFNGVTISKNTFTLNFASIYLEGAHTNISVVDDDGNGCDSPQQKRLKREDLAPSIHALGSVTQPLDSSFASSLQCPKIGRVTSLGPAIGGIQAGVSPPTELLAQRAVHVLRRPGALDKLLVAFAFSSVRTRRPLRPIVGPRAARSYGP